jgi:23S rRNA (guanosine2251-2'-O)-methyltransferase
LEALRAEGGPRVNKLWLVKGLGGGPVEEILREARARGVLFQWVDRHRLTEMLRTAAHQGVAARTSGVVYAELEDLWRKGTPSPLLLLDGITDPHNLGAIARSAVFFGAAAVVIPRWRAAGASGAAFKASAGALAKIPLVQVANMAQTILDLKKKNYWVFGADGAGESCVGKEFPSPFALVVGAEGEGLHRLVKERCDALVAAPGTGAMESLNASCATSVLLYEFFRWKAVAPRS